MIDVTRALLALTLLSTACNREEEPVANRYERQRAEIENKAAELEAQVENDVRAFEARMDNEGRAAVANQSAIANASDNAAGPAINQATTSQ